MVKLYAEIAGGERIAEYLRGLEDRVKAAAGAALDRGADRVRNRAVQKLNAPPKTGRVYKKYKPSRMHQASAKGEYPASDTGTLARSINTDPLFEVEPGISQAAVLTDAAYAAPLEYKAEEDGGRPFLRRAVTEESDTIRDDVRKAVGEAVKP